MRHTTLPAAALLLAALTACSDDPSKPTVSKATDTPSATTSSTPSPSPSPSEDPFKLGDTANISAPSEGFEFSAVALTYKDTGIVGIPETLPEGHKFAAAEVKVCNKGDKTFPVSPFAWSLAYEDGARVDSTHISGGDFPRPLYPLEAKVKGGDCVRGHILFEAPKEGRAERVLYSPSGVDDSVEWQIGK